MTVRVLVCQWKFRAVDEDYEGSESLVRHVGQGRAHAVAPPHCQRRHLSSALRQRLFNGVQVCDLLFAHQVLQSSSPHTLSSERRGVLDVFSKDQPTLESVRRAVILPAKVLLHCIYRTRVSSASQQGA
jgi:hypothetical protein